MTEVEDNLEFVDFEALVKVLKLKQPFPEPYWQGRDFQLCARNQIIRSKRCILSMHKGLGKTSTILSVFEDPQVHKNVPGFAVIIFTNEKGMAAYQRDIKKFPDWEGKLQLIYGAKAKRQKAWNNPTARYFVCTYDGFLSDIGARSSKHEVGRESIIPSWVLKGRVDGVVFDEFHRKMRRRHSKFFEVAVKLFRHTQYLIPMSGSATSKGPEDLWPALHVVDQKFWSSYWKYVATWNYVVETSYGKQVGDPRPDRVKQWRAAVAPHVSHTTLGMVGNQMPPLRRELLQVEIPPWQRKLYNQLITESFLELPDDEYLWAENALTKLHKLRTLLICPQAINQELGIGQGIEDIWEDASESELTRYNIFTPFRAPIPFLESWLSSKGAKVWILQGGIGLDEQERRLRDWRDYIRTTASPESPGILLGTIKYGESWECPESSFAYMLGEEWDPEDNKQAESRLLRLISTRPVFIQYCAFTGTISEGYLDDLVRKSANVRMMFRTWGQVKAAAARAQLTDAEQ